MFTRLVKLVIRPGKECDFLDIFEKSRGAIRNFEGCSGLKLFRDRNYSNIFFTYSIWDSDQSLEAYRKSPLFRETWKKTKMLFADRPAAWSVDLTCDADKNTEREE